MIAGDALAGAIADPRSITADALREVLRYLAPVERMQLFALIEGRAERQDTFREFIERNAPKFLFARHNEILIARLQDVADGLLLRLIVCEPPRHGKSELISRLLPAYFLYRHPELFAALIGFGDTLPRGHSRAARRFYERAGGLIAPDIAAASHWETPEGGGLLAAGIRGGIMGKGFSLGILDDPYKNEKEAQSETVRETVASFYDSAFYTRQAPGAAIVIVLTRWHEQDIVGSVLQSERTADDTPEGWHVMSFDAIHDRKEFDAWRETLPPTVTVEPDPRADGEALWPSRWPVERLRKIRRRMGGPNGYRWRCLYQQRPQPREGGIFLVALITRIAPHALPPLVRVARGWDRAATQGCGDWSSIAPDNPPGDSDWTSGVRVGYSRAGDFYITGYRSGQWSVGARDREIRATVVSDGVAVYQRGEQEPGAAGVADARAFRRLCSGYRSSCEKSSENKALRAGPLASEIEGARFFIVDDGSGWCDRLLHNLGATDFKSGHDDDADALAVAYNWLAIYVVSETADDAEDAPPEEMDDDGSRVVVDYR